MKILNRCMDVLKYRCIVTTECWQIKKRNNKITNQARDYRNKGFTLMELVTVIMLVVVLTIISTPIYNTYTSKARQTDGYLILGTIRSAQDNYYNEYNNYLEAKHSSAKTDLYTCNDTVLGISAMNNNYYTWFTINDGTIDYKIGFKAIVQSKYGNITLRYNRTIGAAII